MNNELFHNSLLQEGILPSDIYSLTNALQMVFCISNESDLPSELLKLAYYDEFISKVIKVIPGRITQFAIWHAIQKYKQKQTTLHHQVLTFNPPKKTTSMPFTNIHQPHVGFSVRHPVEEIPNVHGSYARVVISSDGTRIYAAAYRHVGVWDLRSGDLVGWLDRGERKYNSDGESESEEDQSGTSCHDGFIRDLVLSRCGSFLFSIGAEDQWNILVWNTDKLAPETSLKLTTILPPSALPSSSMHRRIRLGDTFDDFLLVHDSVSSYSLVKFNKVWYMIKQQHIVLTDTWQISASFRFLPKQDSNSTLCIITILNARYLTIIVAFSGIKLRFLKLDEMCYVRNFALCGENSECVSCVVCNQRNQTHDNLVIWNTRNEIVMVEELIPKSAIRAIAANKTIVVISCDHKDNNQEDAVCDIWHTYKNDGVFEVVLVTRLTDLKPSSGFVPESICFTSTGDAIVGGFEGGNVRVWFA
jgi:hypothetical protein